MLFVVGVVGVRASTQFRTHSSCRENELWNSGVAFESESSFWLVQAISTELKKALQLEMQMRYSN